MSENYIMLNGKRVDLTKEQLEKLGLKTKSDCFEREFDGMYYFISDTGDIIETDDITHKSDIGHYNVANYCKDRYIITQRCLHETLSRLLWRFSMQNDGDKIDWSHNSSNYSKYYIYYDSINKCFGIKCNDSHKSFTVYYYSHEIANRAINEIVLPFIKEHPEFVW